MEHNFITSICKSGNRSIPKMFEKIICDEIKNNIFPYIVQEQHGF